MTTQQEIVRAQESLSHTGQKIVQMRVKRVHPGAILPTYQNDGDACFDLHCISGALIGWRKTGCEEALGLAVEFRTGLAFEVPGGYALMIYSRSGHGFNHGLRLSNCVGVIDSGYRGEVKVKLRLDTWGEHYGVMAGDRIAQAMLIPVPHVRLVLAEDLTDTTRGTGGFGSTGVSG
jgi:dUTP pyrophosphatase